MLNPPLGMPEPMTQHQKIENKIIIIIIIISTGGAMLVHTSPLQYTFQKPLAHKSKVRIFHTSYLHITLCNNSNPF
jgi:hypothetical protein